MILAVETSTGVCSVALELADGHVIEKREEGKSIHSEKMFLFMDQLLKGNDVQPEQLSEVLIVSGPGQYTGLRIGASGIKGFLFGLKIPLFTLGTLEAFAAGLICGDHPSGSVIHAVIDARRQHLYHQRFHHREDTVEAGEAGIRKIEEIDRLLKTGDSIVGTGLKRLVSYGRTGMKFYGSDSISAANLITARAHPLFRNRFVRSDPAQFQPDYLSSGQVNNSEGGG